jgi:outer membrane receptor protein involved in Fe transport
MLPAVLTTSRSFAARRRDGGTLEAGRRSLLAGLLFFVGWGLAPPAVAAQDVGRITGRVSEAGTGAPLSDVQVYVADQNLGSLSRQNGTYLIINVPAGTYELRAERIGLTPAMQEITVTPGGTVELNFELAAQALGLDEIVVTGTAGAARRREVGNAVTQINTVDLPERPTSVTSMIQSMAPGVQVDPTGGGGELGQGTQIQIRGINSINTNTSPIIFIDGVRIMNSNLPSPTTPDIHSNSAQNFSSPLDQLNPNDIERIEVISGPAASTLYGTEASAGVIQVFTRRGSARAPVWSAEAHTGTLWNRPFGANGIDYIKMDPWMCSAPFKCGEYMDVPISQNYSLSVRGGAQTLQYFVSGGHDNEMGNTPNDALNRWNVRGNFTVTPMDDMVFQWNTSYTSSTQDNTSSGNNAGGLALNVFRGDQGYIGSDDPELLNGILDWQLTKDIERFTTGGTLTYTPLQNLTNRFTVGYDFTQQESRNMRPFGFRIFPQGGIDVQVYSRRYLSFDYVGTYSFNVMENLRSSFSWGGQATGDFSATVSAWGEGFPGAAFPTVNSASSTLGFESRQKTWNSGFFLQNVFDLQDKYFLTLGLRVDGNSTFGRNFGLQMYPKASGAWVISDEMFWNPSLGELKLRGAWGMSGRAPGAFIAQRTWSNTGLAGEPAFTPGNLGNPDIGPEVTSEVELGFDASWFQDRVRPRFTWYKQTTKDAIQSLSTIPSLGFTSSVNFNVGEVQNWGKELALDVTALRSRNWGLDIGANYSTNGNEVKKWLGSDDPATSVRIGRPIGYSTWTMYQNPDGMGSSRHGATGTYNAQSCFMEGAGDMREMDPSEWTHRPGIDPTVHSCSFSSTLLYGFPMNRPTQLAGGTVTFRMPYSISVSARGDYQGGRGWWRTTNPIPIGRNVISPVCLPYYIDHTQNNLIKPDTPAIWTQRCRNGSGYNHKSNIFQLRTVSATIPMDFAFPDRVQNASLTLVAGNLMTEHHGFFGNYRSSGERVPPPTTIRASLRVVF